MKALIIFPTLMTFFTLLLSSGTFAQTSCTTCTTTNCSKVSFVATCNGSTVYTNNNIPWVAGMNVTVGLSSANGCGSALTVTTSQFPPYGSFVTAINGIAAPANQYWGLYINGTLASYGIDFQQVNAGDAISFSCTPYGSLTNATLASPKASKSKSKKSPAISHQVLFFNSQESLRK